MPHEPKLTVYTITLKPCNGVKENSNRWLFRNIIGEANNNPLTDTQIITSLFRKFITALDTPEMYSDIVSKKCMTANQTADPNSHQNIRLHTRQMVFEGIIEGGSFGRRRNKTSTINKANKSGVREDDAITADFYFFIYLPLNSTKLTLLLQSYTDDTIDSVMKKFWLNFLSFATQFNQPAFKRFIPQSIIEDFKTNSTVSSLTFSTEIPGETLLERTSTQTTKNYKVTVRIDPTDDDLSVEEFEQTIEPLQQTLFTRLMNLGQFTKKKGSLRDTTTNKTSPFDLGTDFEIQPQIQLAKYVTINFNDSDFERIKDYCFELLESIKSEIYIQNAVQER